MLSLEELKPIFDCYKELNISNLRNKVATFKYLWRFRIIDGITKVRRLSNLAFVQQNVFPSEGDDSDKIFVFKMSEVGPDSGVDLVTRMQLSNNLEYAWIMSDHVKCINGWMIMAYHIYDCTYQWVMTIACYDFQFKDKDARVIFWKNFNHIMAENGVFNPQFKGFMADSTYANENADKIVYSSRNPKVPKEGRESTCFFHWVQSLEKHTKHTSYTTCKTNTSAYACNITTPAP